MNQNAPCFSWDQINSELGGHITFASDIISQYKWSDEMRQELQQQLNEIRVKQCDHALNISVIGEFSSGKSTFINALLRMELLEAGVLQGTTVASTIIEYAEEYSFSIRYLSGEENTVCAGSFQELKTRLSTIVAENEDARAYAAVVVRLPSPSLRDNSFRIIDTPGLDATVQWHETATRRTLQDFSDLSIILVDAVRPLPESLCDFITEHLETIVEQCVFVVTRLDLIPPRERKMLLRYVAQTAQVRFGLASPLVLPYSSVEVLNHFLPGSYDVTKYIPEPEVSLASEERIMEHTDRQRALVQARKLLALTDRIYHDISRQMEELTSNYQQRLSLLLRTKQADLTDFIAEQKVLSKNTFDTLIREAYRRMLGTVNALPGQAIGGIFASIDSQYSNAQVDAYVRLYLVQDCQYQANLMCQKIAGLLQHNSSVTAIFNRILFEYRTAFQQKFRQLSCLPPEPGHASVVLPPIAPIQPAALSGVLFGPKSGNPKLDAKQKLYPHLTRYFNNVAISLKYQIDRFIFNTRSRLDVEIDRYLTAYQKTVDTWILEEQRKRAGLEKTVSRIQQDMLLIDRHKQQLCTVRELLQPHA